MLESTGKTHEAKLPPPLDSTDQLLQRGHDLVDWTSVREVPRSTGGLPRLSSVVVTMLSHELRKFRITFDGETVVAAGRLQHTRNRADEGRHRAGIADPAKHKAEGP